MSEIESDVSRVVEDPTAQITKTGDNAAEATRLSPPNLGEVAGGRSALDYAGGQAIPMSRDEFELAKADWLANPFVDVAPSSQTEVVVRLSAPVTLTAVAFLGGLVLGLVLGHIY